MVLVEERAELLERPRRAEGATAVEREIRGAAVAVRRLLRRAARELRLAPLAVLTGVHEPRS